MFKYFLFFITSFVFAQKPFSKENPSNTFAVKVCAYVNLLDGGFGSIVGAEKGFFKNHSIGGKFIYNYFTPHRENTLNGTYDPIDYTKDRDLSFIVEYKYYFDFESLKEIPLCPYISLSYKTGKNTIDNDREYPHDYYHQEIKYNYFGPALGCLILKDNDNPFSIDTQLGYLFGKKNLMTEYEVPYRYDFAESYNTTRWRFEIMLAYNFNW